MCACNNLLARRRHKHTHSDLIKHTNLNSGGSSDDENEDDDGGDGDGGGDDWKVR